MHFANQRKERVFWQGWLWSWLQKHTNVLLRYTNVLYRGFTGFQGGLCSILNLSNICVRRSTNTPLYTPFLYLHVSVQAPSTQVQSKVLAYVPGIGPLHPANCRTGKAGGGEGQVGRKSRQEQDTTDWKEQSCVLLYSRESFWGGELMHITLCLCEEVREVISPEKKLADRTLQNLAFPRCHRKVNFFIPDHCFLLNCPHSCSCFHLETPLQVGYVLSQDFLPTNIVCWMHVFKKKKKNFTQFIPILTVLISSGIM